MNYQSKLGLMLNYIFSNLLPEPMIEKFSEIIFSDNVIQYQLRNNILADVDSIHMSMRIRDYEITIDGLLYSAETFPEFLDIICPNLWFESRDRIIHNFNQLCDRLLFLFNFDTLDKEKMMDFLSRKQKGMRFYDFLIYCGAAEADAKTLNIYRQDFPNDNSNIKEIVEDQKFLFYSQKAMETRSRSIKISDLIEFELI